MLVPDEKDLKAMEKLFLVDSQAIRTCRHVCFTVIFHTGKYVDRGIS